MEMITTTEALETACQALAHETFVTVDTEFVRDKTYYPGLCLIQLGAPDEVYIVDPLADGIDLAPLIALFDDESTLKVFHAAKQDVEIFVNLVGRVPTPIYDTQIAAMVCGFGDQVGYETLVSHFTQAKLDKSSRFTDWSRRPLTDRQITYAANDVTHLRIVYEELEKAIAKNNRAHWVAEEMAVLSDPSGYVVEPAEAWRRIKTRTRAPAFLARLKSLAAWREHAAQDRNIPRGRILKDEALLEVAAHDINSTDDMLRLRGVPEGFVKGRLGKALLEAAIAGQEMPEEDHPTLPKPRNLPSGIGATVELLKVLLRFTCDSADVAPKLLANTRDLELIAADGDKAEVRALKGWRRELFGEEALALREGKIALTVTGRKIEIIDVDG